jgi:hypothetical protein
MVKGVTKVNCDAASRYLPNGCRCGTRYLLSVKDPQNGFLGHCLCSLKLHPHCYIARYLMDKYSCNCAGLEMRSLNIHLIYFIIIKKLSIQCSSLFKVECKFLLPPWPERFCQPRRRTVVTLSRRPVDRRYSRQVLRCQTIQSWNKVDFSQDGEASQKK